MRSHYLPWLKAGTCLILLILVCGCDYVPNHDIIVIRLQQDGSMAWVRTLDSGYDDDARDMIELTGGDLLVAGRSAGSQYGPSTAKLSRLAPDGTVRSNQPYPGIAGEITSVVLTGNGNLSLATYDGWVYRLDPDGTIIRSTSTGMTGVWTQAATPDGGVVVAGGSQGLIRSGSVAEIDRNGTVSTRAPLPNESRETPGCRETILQAGDRQIPVTECVGEYQGVSQAAMARLDDNGTIVWQKSYGAYGLESSWSVAAAGTGQGYYMSAYGMPAGSQGTANHRYAVRLDDNGSVSWITDTGASDFYSTSRWVLRHGGVDLIFSGERIKPGGSINIQPTVLDLAPEGNITGTMPVDASPAIFPTADGGFFSAGIPVSGGTLGYDSEIYGSPDGNTLHAMKFRTDAGKEWDRVIEGVSVTSVRQVIQTSDGGYAILALLQKR